MAQPFSVAPSSYAFHSSEATLADVGAAIVRRWRWVAIPTVLAFLGSLAFVLLVTPRYTGEAKLILQASDSVFTRPGNERPEQAPQIDEQAVASQVQVVMSRDLAREAIKRLGLVGNPEFDPFADGLGPLRRLAIFLRLSKDPRDRPAEDRVLEKYYDNLLVYPVGKSRIVAIEFKSKDAELAAKAANTIADLYLGLQDETKKDQARSASTWLGSNIDSLRKRVADAEAKVEAFRAKTGLLSGTGTTTLSAQQLSELSTQLAQARTARSDAQAKAQLIREAIKNGRAFDIPDVANNELIRRLMEQRINLRAQLALEQRTLLAQHPRIKELNAQVTDLENQIRLAAERTVRTLENDARIAGSRVESIEAAIESQKKVVAQANENEVQLRALEREARIQREQLETYLGRYREASARDTDYGAPPDARIVSRAITPQTPSFPKKLPIVALSTLAAFVFSVGAIVSRELLGSRPAAASPFLPYGSEAAGPVFPAEPGVPQTFRFDLDHLRRGPILEGEATASTPEDATVVADRDFVALVGRLSRAEIGERGRIVLVDGVEGGRDDAMAVARGLASTLSRRAPVLLLEVDADEVTPVDAVPGLTDLVAGEAGFADVIQREAGSNLHRIATGTLLNEALLDSPESLDVALTAFASTYEWTVCALLRSDDEDDRSEDLLASLAPLVDAVCLASNLGPSDRELVEAYEAARAAGAKDVVVAREEPEALDEAA